MKHYIFITFLVLLSLRLEASDLQVAKTLISKGSSKVAIEILNKITKNQLDFPEASEALVQEYFKLKEYSKLFATAIFYRTWLSNHDQKDNYRPRIFALEALSLAGKCYFEEADIILDSSSKYSKKFSSTKDFVLVTKEQIKMAKSFPEFLRTKNPSNVKQEGSDHRGIWKIDIAMVRKLKSSRNLEIELEDKCQD